MLRRLHRAAAAAAALAVVAACQGGRRGPPPDRFVPADAVAAVVVPEVGRAARELGAIHATIAGFPGAAEMAESRGALAAQLGFDPLDPEALADAGLDPRRGAAFAAVRRDAPGGRSALLVLPVDDAPKLEALFVRLARDRLGATERVAESGGGASVVVLRRPGSAVPALAYAIVQRSAILCAGPGAPAVVREAASLAPQASLAEASGWKAARLALGADVAAVQFVPAGSPLLAGMWPLADGGALGVSASPGRLVARAAVLLGSREPSFKALAADGQGGKAAARLDPEAQLAGRWDGDFGALGRKIVPMVSPADRAKLAAKGVDLERDVFGVLAPGGAMTVSLAPGLDVAGLTWAKALGDPLRAVQFEAILPVKDAEAALAASARISGRGRRAARSADTVFRIRTATGEIAWVVDAAASRILAAGGPPGRLDALRARVADGRPGFSAPTPGSAAALAGGLGGAVLHVPRLVDAVRAMPEQAFGTGPSGFVMRSLVDRIVDPAARLSAVSLHADLVTGALVVTLEAEAREMEASR